MNEITELEAWLRSDCEAIAVYFSDADCVEYVSEDTTCIYRRVDQILTLIYDETNAIPIGFKLKGFKRILETMRERYQLNDSQFVELVQVLESICTTVGEEMFSDSHRKSAYDAAAKLAKDVKLYDLPLAA